MKKYILFILILLIGTSINIAPEEGHFDFSQETARHTTGFALWIETHNLALEKDRIQSQRAGSDAELRAILDSGLPFNMPLPLIGASEGIELAKLAQAQRQNEEAQLKIAAAEKELALAEKALQEKLAQEAQILEQEKAEQEAKELAEKLQAEAEILEKEKEEAEANALMLAQLEAKAKEEEQKKIENEANKPNALDNTAEVVTTETTKKEETVVAQAEKVKAFPLDLASDNVDMTQYSIQNDGDNFIALFTLMNKGNEVQSGNITFSISFEDGETMPFVGYVGTYRFSMQVPKNYPLRLSAAMIEHAKVAAPRMITIYLQNNKNEVFFRKNIMVTN